MNSTEILYNRGAEGSHDLFFSLTPFAKKPPSRGAGLGGHPIGTAENQIPDVGHSDYIADHFFKTNIGGLHCAERADPVLLQDQSSISESDPCPCWF